MNWNILKRNTENKANSEKQNEKEKLTKQGFAYRITICDPLGESPRELDTFGAKKSRDDDGVVWLANDSKNFYEIFPLDNDFTVKYTTEEIKEEIKRLEAKKIKPDENKLNKESKLLELKKLLKALEHSRGSFLKIDKDGMPHITYVRYRTSLIPMKWNIDFSTIHTPVEPLIKNVLTTHVSKMRKYNQNKENFITGGVIVFLLILVAWSGVLAYFTLKYYDTVDNSRVQDLQNRIDEAPLICAELYGKAGANFYNTSVYSVKITKELYDKLNPTVPVEKSTTSLE